MKKLILILVVLLVQLSLSAQDKRTYLSIDKETYNLYLKKQWKPLLKIAKQAKEQNISFYYLDYRMGIAYYELKDYRKAIPFFKEVLEQFPNDNLGLEYLFYSYLGAGYFEDARALWLRFEPELQSRIPLYNKEMILNGVGIDFKYFQNSDYQKKISFDNTLKQRVNTSMRYYGLNLSHLFKGTFSLFHSLSFMAIKNNVYDSEYDDDFIEERIKQTEYYALGNIHLAEKTDFKIGIHFLNDYIVGSGEELATNGSGWGGGNGLIQQTYYVVNVFNFVGFVAYEKGISNFKLKASSSISNLNKEFQVQPSLAIYYFPLGNKKISFGAESFYQLTRNEIGSVHSLMNKQQVNFNFANRLNINAFFLYGKMSGFVDNNAIMVYNNIDKINYSYGGSLSLGLGANTYLYSILQYYSRENQYTVNSDNFIVNYNLLTILGGISWNF